MVDEKVVADILSNSMVEKKKPYIYEKFEYTHTFTVEQDEELAELREELLTNFINSRFQF